MRHIARSQDKHRTALSKFEVTGHLVLFVFVEADERQLCVVQFHRVGKQNRAVRDRLSEEMTLASKSGNAALSDFSSRWSEPNCDGRYFRSSL
jgi:hypothetical protein